ncbi:hypothetical protein B0F90DRAFT_959044 [Multifurca ochricompacta]|uniref:Uncharacterized protein n=1 Tax=Multifurca ochricompacta TaxID=376703 RepID=A0AAD4MBD3_9AGAM|nr:hypothetical protein B0F90DRAFT_959044 [Multifurca ochricompacta]
MLNEMRHGALSRKSIARFRQLSREISYDDGIGPTELFPRRQDVDSANNLRMSCLRGESKTYHAKDGGWPAAISGRSSSIILWPRSLAFNCRCPSHAYQEH